jgi:hypothetical protein
MSLRSRRTVAVKPVPSGKQGELNTACHSLYPPFVVLLLLFAQIKSIGIWSLSSVRYDHTKYQPSQLRGNEAEIP